MPELLIDSPFDVLGAAEVRLEPPAQLRELHDLRVGQGKPALPTDARAELELVDDRRFTNGVVYLRHRNFSQRFHATLSPGRAAHASGAVAAADRDPGGCRQRCAPGSPSGL
jgi:hypothetical protein